jgi:hypothetical protein
MADNSNPGPLEIADAVQVIAETIIDLKVHGILTQANVDKANDILSDFLDKLKAGVASIDLTNQGGNTSTQVPTPAILATPIATPDPAK